MANKSCARAHQKSAENTTWYDINWTNCLTNANRWCAISIFVLIKMDFSVKPLETLWALMEPWLLRGLWLPAQIGDPDSLISHGQCHRKWFRLGTFGGFVSLECQTLCGQRSDKNICYTFPQVWHVRYHFTSWVIYSRRGNLFKITPKN